MAYQKVNPCERIVPNRQGSSKATDMIDKQPSSSHSEIESIEGSPLDSECSIEWNVEQF